MLSPDKDIKDLVIEKVRRFDIRNDKEYHEKYPQPFRTAAVLLPLKLCNGEVFILLTKRAKSLRSHASETSFPGGMVEEMDSSIIETALREADEEIGLHPSSVEVIGVLSRGITMRKTIVYPVVGLIPSDFQASINPSEVEFAFFVPLKDFLCKEKISTSIFRLRFASYINRQVVFKDGDSETSIWGFTSTFCIVLSQIVLGTPDYLDMHVGCKNTGNVSDCVAEYFRLCYNFILADSCCKL